MQIYNARGKQGNRQGQIISGLKNRTEPSRDQYGHRLYSVMGRGSSAVQGLNNQTVYVDNIERFKGTAKACKDYCNTHYYRDYVIVSLFRA
jgi:hypothetical protein